MEKVAGHTAGKWYVSGDDEFDGVPFIEISCGECPSPEYRSICHVQPQFDEGTDGFELDGEARANAAFIVQAVNSHDELVKLLQEVLEWNEDDADLATNDTAFRLKNFADTCSNRSAAIRKALSRATKQEE